MNLYTAFIGIASFICGILVMYAIHRVVFDYYSNEAEKYIDMIKKEGKTKIEVEHRHTYATPDDVIDLKFNDYLED